MKWIAPDYYPHFQCKAGKCRHSCCIGWEIGIDEETLDFYRSLPGGFGDRLRQNILERNEDAVFHLNDKEHCPFLNREGLCDIILTLGEEALCQICTDHPRFFSWFSDRTELGLGLCCEEAASLILGAKKPVRLITLREDETNGSLSLWERTILQERDLLIRIAQDRSRSLEQRMHEISLLPERTFSHWADLLISLEQMDPEWSRMLCRAKDLALVSPPPSIIGEQLLVYFLYRHLPCAQDTEDLRARTAFAVLSTQIILELIGRLPDIPPEEIARLYSAEIEYSEENTDILLDVLYE